MSGQPETPPGRSVTGIDAGTGGTSGPAVPLADELRSLSLRLREETREAHERVENTASFNRLVVIRLPKSFERGSSEEYARRGRAVVEYQEVYRRFLVAAHGFEAAVERALGSGAVLEEARVSGWTPEDPTGSSLIRDDLTSVFGHAAALPEMDPLPLPRTLAALIGMEYVRRGSRAGAAVIGAVVAHNLGFTRERGAGFLLRYGRETRALITGFKTWVDELRLDEAAMGAAVVSAVDTFLAVERWHRWLEREFERAPGT